MSDPERNLIATACGLVLRQHRRVAGYNQQRVADDISVSHAVYAAYDRGERPLDLYLCAKVAQIFKLDRCELIKEVFETAARINNAPKLQRGKS